MIAFDTKIGFGDSRGSEIVIGYDIEFTCIFTEIILAGDPGIERLDIEDLSLDLFFSYPDAVTNLIITYQQEVGEEGDDKGLEGDEDCSYSDSKDAADNFVLGEKIDKKQ